jgi:signal transduction histidine kinase
MAITARHSDPTRRTSLELRLPLLITALVCAVIGAFLGGSYLEVRQSATLAAEKRVQDVAGLLAQSFRGNIQRRAATVRSVSSRPAVRNFLREGSNPDAARQTIAGLRIQGDTIGLPIEIWSADRTPLISVDALAAEEPSLMTEWHAQTNTVPAGGGYGQLFRARGGSYYWVATPVIEGDTIGWVAELHQLRSTTTGEQIQQLLGSGVNLLFATVPGGSTWHTLDGDSIAAPEEWPFTGGHHYTRPGDGDRIGFAAQIENTAWYVISEAPASLVLARPRAFLRRAALIAIAIIILFALIALPLVRNVTKPLRRLTVASQEIAAGNYEHRVDVDRTDELGTLADTFNAMAERVQTAHREMERQFGEARALAGDLADANAQLTEAMSVADASRAEAQKASRAKSDFLATMSHEIRTPINAMIGYTDLLELGLAGPLTGEQREQLTRIRTSGRHLVGLVDEILDLAGIESGRMRLDPRVASLEQTVDTALSILRPQAFAKGVRLAQVCQCKEDALFVGDERRTEQIIVNLVSNAVKFTNAEGQVTVRCGTIVTQSGRWSQVTVEDTGIGIPADQLDRIFEPFVQADGGYTRTHGGVGLGLAISRRLARMMGGDIEVESRQGAGSRFTLRLLSAPDGVHAGDSWSAAAGG